jgi:hypothetical protein
MLLDLIRAEPTLQDFLRDVCSENDVGVSIDPSVFLQDYVIIKVDEYFRSSIKPTPKGIDCLVVQKCVDNRYKLYLIELKNIEGINSGEDFKRSIYEKIQNTFDILMSNHFRSMFYNLDYQFTSIEPYFVSNLIKDKKQKNSKLDALLAMRPFRFADRRYGLKLGEPLPLITPC